MCIYLVCVISSGDGFYDDFYMYFEDHDGVVCFFNNILKCILVMVINYCKNMNGNITRTKVV